jgi:hypothetical protein|tara:strand:- start:213 stop:359 length:147 start_codon:yes stop_codon:yes gene_type:complete
MSRLTDLIAQAKAKDASLGNELDAGLRRKVYADYIVCIKRIKWFSEAM